MYDQFTPGSGHGGDRLALSQGRVHAGRSELHDAVLAEMRRTQDLDYEAALDRVTDGTAFSDVRTLSAAARAGTGLAATEPAPGPLHDARDASRFDDAAAFCQASNELADGSRFAELPDHVRRPAIDALLARRDRPVDRGRVLALSQAGTRGLDPGVVERRTGAGPAAAGTGGARSHMVRSARDVLGA